MNLDVEPAKKTQVKELLLLMFFSLAAAFGVTFFFIYTYGPTGQYLVETTLLEPKLLTQLNYNDYNKITNAQDRFVFDHLTFSYYDQKSQVWKNVPATEMQYSQFYEKVAGQKSLSSIPEETVRKFAESNPAKLSIYVRTESPAAWQKETKLFQEVQFVENYFRVELHEQEPGTNWAYFYYPRIYEDAVKLFFS